MAVIVTLIERLGVSRRDEVHPAGRASLGMIVALAMAMLLAPFIGEKGQVLLAICLIGAAIAGFCFAFERVLLWGALLWSLATAAAGVRVIFLDLYDSPGLIDAFLAAATVQAVALLWITAPVWLASWRARAPALASLAGAGTVILLILSPLTAENTGDSTLVAMLDLLALPLAVLARRLAMAERLRLLRAGSEPT